MEVVTLLDIFAVLWDCCLSFQLFAITDMRKCNRIFLAYLATDLTTIMTDDHDSVMDIGQNIWNKGLRALYSACTKFSHIHNVQISYT